MEMEGESLFLPEELEIEVLLRFPVKSLVRFKSVCKRWHSLIRSPSFISCYNRLAANTRKINGELLCFREDPITRTHYISLFDDQTVEKIHDLEWPPFLDEGIEEAEENYTRGISVLGPVNGIYCIYRRLIEWWVGTFVLWNPATREYEHILPPISFPFSSNLLAGLWNLHQDFDEMRYGKYIDIGFEFDQTTNDYKLVVICHSRLAYGPGDEFWHVRVFSCATDSWKTICSLGHGDVFPQFDLGYPPFPEIYSNPEHSHCLLNGVYHWTCILRYGYPGADLQYPILAFDFADEAFRLMRGPPLPPKDHEQPRSLWVLRETLTLVATCCESVEVW